MSDDSIDHLDWELDEGWVPLDGGWGTVTHFQIVPGSLSIVTDDPPARINWNAVIGYAVMLTITVPFWLLAGYGLYCLVWR